MKPVWLLLGFLLFTLSSAQETSYLVIKGSFVILGKEPDGDSVRFIADQTELFKKLKRGYKIKPSKDGSVQLRFEAIDAPELHYQGKSQPLAEESRDSLLSMLGFSYVANSKGKILESQPKSIRGGILSQSAETNGRPVSYVFLAQELAAFDDGARIYPEQSLLQSSLNAQMLAVGMAYYTVYSSQPESHRKLMYQLAKEAKEAARGLWQLDTTDAFFFKNAEDVSSQLILPKLFRRSVDYFRAVDKGFSGTLIDWLEANPSKDDAILLGARQTTLSRLLIAEASTLYVLFDPLEAVFLEK